MHKVAVIDISIGRIVAAFSPNTRNQLSRYFSVQAPRMRSLPVGTYSHPQTVFQGSGTTPTLSLPKSAPRHDGTQPRRRGHTSEKIGLQADLDSDP